MDGGWRGWEMDGWGWRDKGWKHRESRDRKDRRMVKDWLKGWMKGWRMAGGRMVAG